MLYQSGLLSIVNWTNYGDYYYRLFDGPKSWSDAGYHCREFTGGHLVSIHSEAENNFVYNLWRAPLGANEAIRLAVDWKIVIQRAILC